MKSEDCVYESRRAEMGEYRDYMTMECASWTDVGTKEEYGDEDYLMEGETNEIESLVKEEFTVVEHPIEPPSDDDSSEEEEPPADAPPEPPADAPPEPPPSPLPSSPGSPPPSPASSAGAMTEAEGTVSSLWKASVVRVHMCSMCGEQFRRKVDLGNHLVGHQTVRPYACRICSRLFVQKSFLDSHGKESHGKDRPYSCRRCGSDFTRQSSLSNHMKTHIPISLPVTSTGHRQTYAATSRPAKRGAASKRNGHRHSGGGGNDDDDHHAVTTSNVSGDDDQSSSGNPIRNHVSTSCPSVDLDKQTNVAYVTEYHPEFRKVNLKTYPGGNRKKKNVGDDDQPSSGNPVKNHVSTTYPPPSLQTGSDRPVKVAEEAEYCPPFKKISLKRYPSSSSNNNNSDMSDGNHQPRTGNPIKKHVSTSQPPPSVRTDSDVARGREYCPEFKKIVLKRYPSSNNNNNGDVNGGDSLQRVGGDDATLSTTGGDSVQASNACERRDDKSPVDHGTPVSEGSPVRNVTAVSEGAPVSNGTAVLQRSSVRRGMAVPQGSSVRHGTAVPQGSYVRRGTVISQGSSVRRGTAVPQGFSVRRGTVVSQGSSVRRGTVVSQGSSVRRGTAVPQGSSVRRGHDVGIQEKSPYFDNSVSTTDGPHAPSSLNKGEGSPPVENHHRRVGAGVEVDASVSVRGVASGRPHVCDTCGKAFARVSALRSHLRFHREWGDDDDDDDGRRSVKTSGDAVCNKDGAKSPGPAEDAAAVRCAHCGKTFASRQGYALHVRVHVGRLRPRRRDDDDKGHTCEYCGKAFTRRQGWVVHTRTHTGEKPYTCTYCKKAFADLSTLRRHVRVHTGERPHPCPLCPKAFNQKAALREHVHSIHPATVWVSSTGSVCYKCVLCPTLFPQSRLLYVHMMEHSDKLATTLKATRAGVVRNKNVTHFSLLLPRHL